MFNKAKFIIWYKTMNLWEIWEVVTFTCTEKYEELFIIREAEKEGRQYNFVRYFKVKFPFLEIEVIRYTQIAKMKEQNL